MGSSQHGAGNLHHPVLAQEGQATCLLKRGRGQEQDTEDSLFLLWCTVSLGFSTLGFVWWTPSLSACLHSSCSGEKGKGLGNQAESLAGCWEKARGDVEEQGEAGSAGPASRETLCALHRTFNRVGTGLSLTSRVANTLSLS